MRIRRLFFSMLVCRKRMAAQRTCCTLRRFIR